MWSNSLRSRTTSLSRLFENKVLALVIKYKSIFLDQTTIFSVKYNLLCFQISGRLSYNFIYYKHDY